MSAGGLRSPAEAASAWRAAVATGQWRYDDTRERPFDQAGATRARERYVRGELTFEQFERAVGYRGTFALARQFTLA